MRKALIFVINQFMNLVTYLTIEGVEKIPEDRPAVIVANNIGFLDAFFLLTIKEVINDPKLVVIVAEKYEQKAFYRWAVKVLGFMFIDRYNSDVKTLKTVLRRLKNNGLLVIAPEGTRSPDSKLIQAQDGAAYLAAKTNAVIIPITATGCSDKVIKENLFKKKFPVKIKFGEPFYLPGLPKKNRDEFLTKQTEEIMCRIAAMLPESYRGFYSDHPRTKELLKE